MDKHKSQVVRSIVRNFAHRVGEIIDVDIELLHRKLTHAVTETIEMDDD